MLIGLAVLIAVAVIIVVYLASYERGRKAGYRSGFATGDTQGRKIGRDTGYLEGKDVGYADGLHEGRREIASVRVELDDAQKELEARDRAAFKSIATPAIERSVPSSPLAAAPAAPAKRKPVPKKRGNGTARGARAR